MYIDETRLFACRSARESSCCAAYSFRRQKVKLVIFGAGILPLRWMLGTYFVDRMIICCSWNGSGHLYCWACLYQWLSRPTNAKNCPVCKSGASLETIVPLYVRGEDSSAHGSVLRRRRCTIADDRSDNSYADVYAPIPARPLPVYVGEHFDDSAASTTMGYRLDQDQHLRQRRASNQTPISQDSGASSHARYSTYEVVGDDETTEFLSRLLLILGSFVVLCLLLFWSCGGIGFIRFCLLYVIYRLLYMYVRAYWAMHGGVISISYNVRSIVQTKNYYEEGLICLEIYRYDWSCCKYVIFHFFVPRASLGYKSELQVVFTRTIYDTCIFFHRRRDDRKYSYVQHKNSKIWWRADSVDVAIPRGV